MQAVCIIPARWRSQRFPGKLSVPIAGIPMIERVWRGAKRCGRLREVIIATDDLRIARLCEGFGATVAMTSSLHPTGTDRIAEVAALLADELIVNVQGDEPLIEPFVIEAALDALIADPGASMSTVAHPADESALDDPNRVKLVMDRRGRALYFSRSPIPAGRRDPGQNPRPHKTHWQHVGVYAYRKQFLLDFVGLAQGEAEQAEGLEQLRALEHGHAIAVGRVEGWCGVPVDVPGDVARVERALAEIGLSRGIH
jgi:3-deoxy-manno-octulosonate cytidylyltransferase (CMP-KDO synthetase)